MRFPSSLLFAVIAFAFKNLLMEITRHFTATLFILFEDRVLLHMHKRQNRWLPVGGHIERDELPHEAVLREAKEEAGLEVELFQSNAMGCWPGVQELLPPQRMLLETINEFHQHIDFIFYGRAKTDVIDPVAEEFETLRWFTLDEMELEEEMPADVLALAREAVERLSDFSVPG